MSQIQHHIPLREYIGLVRNGDEPSREFSVVARTPREAEDLVRAEFGECLITSLRRVVPSDGREQERKPGQGQEHGQERSQEQNPLKEYIGVVWVGDEPGQRFVVLARGSWEAGEYARAEFGDYPMTLHNEEDAHKPR